MVDDLNIIDNFHQKICYNVFHKIGFNKMNDLSGNTCRSYFKNLADIMATLFFNKSVNIKEYLQLFICCLSSTMFI